MFLCLTLVSLVINLIYSMQLVLVLKTLHGAFGLRLNTTTTAAYFDTLVAIDKEYNKARNTNWRGRLSTVDLPVKLPCFVKR